MPCPSGIAAEATPTATTTAAQPPTASSAFTARRWGLMACSSVFDVLTSPIIRTTLKLALKRA
jgi:hypothetical protein